MHRRGWYVIGVWGSFLVQVAGILAEPPVATRDRNWSHWRGPQGTGVAPLADPPVEWSENDGTNLRWKTVIPGLGHSTPIVWENLVFLTTAIPDGPALAPRYSQAPGAHDNVPVTRRQQFAAVAIERQTGKIRWQRTLRTAVPHEGHHNTGSYASSSPVTNGEHVYFSFGSYGVFCLDFEGQTRWQVELGLQKPLHGHGEGSSPVLAGGLLVVNWDHEGESFVVALDHETGAERWRVPRDETTSWSSPIVVERDGVQQVIVSATNRIRGYELQTGRELWSCAGLSTNVVASPVSGDGMLFAGSSYDTRALLAIDLDGAQGDLTGTRRVVWRRNRGTPYVPSPLLYGESLYYLNHYQGVMTRLTARTGEDSPGTFRLAGLQDLYASPVGAAGRVYITDRTGTTLVISHADKPRVLAENRLDDVISASAAIAGKELFLRGARHLYCLAAEDR